jgi:hypothetical protein
VTDSIPPTGDAARNLALRMEKASAGADLYDVFNATILVMVHVIGLLAEEYGADAEGLCDEVAQQVRVAATYDWARS